MASASSSRAYRSFAEGLGEQEAGPVLERRDPLGAQALQRATVHVPQVADDLHARLDVLRGSGDREAIAEAFTAATVARPRLCMLIASLSSGNLAVKSSKLSEGMPVLGAGAVASDRELVRLATTAVRIRS